VNQFFNSSIGRKYIVGLTGIALILFLIAHLLGNLQIFAGPKAINDYAEFLKSVPQLVWPARAGLLLMFVLHFTFALKLYLENKAARPKSYAVDNTVQATVASRIMALSGTIILMFVIGHLLHFTLGIILPEYAELQDAQGRHDVYSMVIKGFQVTPVALFYIIALLLLWSHLSHGISSVFQSLGITHSKKGIIGNVGPILSSILIIGYISIPLSIMFGLVQ
jgi:succinate dehydrogenase / fumarate reductase cytochrome b subunit